MSYYGAVQVAAGTWRDHTNDGVLILTLADREASILTAFMVIFVSFVASSAWGIARYLLHQLRATGVTRDGYHHQLQTILRNSTSHFHTTWATITVALGWKRQIGLPSALKRSSIVLIASVVSLFLWSAAQLFIPLIWANASDRYPARREICGMFQPPDGPDRSRLMTGFMLSRMDSAATYVERCYGNRSDASECSTLPVSRLAWTTDDVPCPFTESKLCKGANVTPMRLRSGKINSNIHLGANAPLEESIDYRQVAICSPMELRVRVGPNKYSEEYGEVHLDYGPEFQNGLLRSNSTFTYTSAWKTGIDGYRLFSFSYDPVAEPKLHIWRANASIIDRPDASASIFFLDTNSVGSLNAIGDPWFLTSANAPNNTRSVHVPATDISVLGCIEERELCNPRSGACLPITPSTPFNYVYEKLELTGIQQATFLRLRVQLSMNDLSKVAMMTPRPLLASRTTHLAQQNANIPNDQWRIEIGRWFSISLHLIQRGFVDSVAEPANDLALQNHFDFATDPAMAAECGRQQIRNAVGYRNFNLTPIIVTLVVGTIVILVGLGIEGVVGWLQKRFRRGERRRVQWLLDGAFQLQRLAYEAAGVGPWQDADCNVPVTSVRHFPPVDVRDATHPRLYNMGPSAVRHLPADDIQHLSHAPTPTTDLKYVALNSKHAEIETSNWANEGNWDGQANKEQP